MSYTITKKIKPKGVDFILFYNKNEATGTINFNDMNLKKIAGLTENVISDEVIEINFPISDHYFTMEYKSKNGWTLKKLLTTINKIAIVAGQYIIKYQPHMFLDSDNPSPADFVDKFYIHSNSKKSDIMKKNNKIYINTNINHDINCTTKSDDNTIGNNALQ